MGISSLLFITPKRGKSAEPVRDEITLAVEKAFNASKPCGPYWKGTHECRCGARSANHDFRLPNGWITNSLAVHYVEWHRNELPEQELRKLRILYESQQQMAKNG
jgi:hypothetical protein